MAKGAATIYDVAQLANVSIATVSRVLTGAAPVRADTRERVEAAIAQLGFVPSSAARGLSGGRRGSIALVYPLDEERSGAAPLREDNASVLYNDGIIRGATWQASLHGYLLFACAVRIDNGTEGTSIHQISSSVDGLILTDRAVKTVRSMRTATRMRAVQLSGSGLTKFGGSIQVDNEGGMRQTVIHLAYSHGVRSFGYVGGIADSHDAVARSRAFAQAVRDVGAVVEARNVMIGEFSMTRAADVMNDRLNEPVGLPQAFVCANDQMAVGVIRTLQARGYRVPEDVLVTGFDDIPLASQTNPALTTVAQPTFDLGAAAVTMVMGLLDGVVAPGASQTVSTELIVRSSCGCSEVPVVPATTTNVTPTAAEAVATTTRSEGEVSEP